MAYFLQNRHIMMKTDSGNRNLDNLSWDYIGELCARDEAGEIDISKYFKVGDTKTVHINEITGNPGTWYYDTYGNWDVTFKIIGIHQDIMENGNKAALTFAQTPKSLIRNWWTSYKEPSYTHEDGTSGYTEEFMQYDNSTIRKFLTNYYEQALPTSLQKNIKTVNKATIQGADYNTATIKYVVPNSEYNKTLCCNKVVTSERCFIMSIKEAFGEYNWITEYDEAEQYQYFAINGLDYEYNSTDAYMGSSYGSLRDTYNQISNISREIDPYGYRIYANGARYELSSIDLGGIIYWFNPCFSI